MEPIKIKKFAKLVSKNNQDLDIKDLTVSLKKCTRS